MTDWKFTGGYIPLDMNDYIHLQALHCDISKSMYLRILIQRDMKQSGVKELIKSLASRIAKDWEVYRIKKGHETLFEFLLKKKEELQKGLSQPTVNQIIEKVHNLCKD